MSKKTTKHEEPLCTLYESDGMRAELYREGEGFRLRFAGSNRKERTFDSLPNLLSGLHGIFVEIRMGNRGVRGLDALARVADDAREDVLSASRKIHQALDAD